MNRTLLVVFVALAAVMAESSPAPATSLVPVDVPELSQHAIAIVHGRVVSVRPQWTDGRRRVETLVGVAVRQYLKGHLGETVIFRLPGGELGRYRSVMVGAPTFREGDEVVLFLGARGPSMPFLLGLGQGVFRVVRERTTGRQVVVPPPLGTAAKVSGPVVRGASERRPVPIAEFVEQVRSLVGAGRALRPGPAVPGGVPARAVARGAAAPVTR